jgi:hypothetical protein
VTAPAGPGPPAAGEVPVCDVCPYGVVERCEGPRTGGSLRPLRDGAIGCFDAAEQVRYYRDLHRLWIPPPEGPAAPPVPPLPAFLPVLARGLPSRLRLAPGRTYAIPYRSFLYRSGRLRYRQPRQLTPVFRLAEGARLALISNTRDRRLEGFWALSEAEEVWSAIGSLGFDFATSCTFSVWGDDPRFDQIFNQERNLYSYDRLTAAGVPTAPFLFFATPRDLEVALRWLEAHPEVETVAVLAQMQRPRQEFDECLAELRALRDGVGRPLRFLVVGVATAAKLEALFAEFPTATVATTKPALKAVAGWQTTPELDHEQVPEIPREELVAVNFRRYAAFCEACRRRSHAAA